MLLLFVSTIISLSTPIAQPAWGGIPNLKALRW